MRTAKQIAADLRANSDALYANAVSHVEHGRRNRVLWDEVELRSARFCRLVMKALGVLT